MAAKKRGYRLSPLAEADLENIWDYTVETWSVDQAEIYHTSFVTTFEELARGTKMGRVSDVRDGYFKYAVGLHMIYFKQTDSGIDVIRVLHQKMDVSRHL